jgi:hypothetical protein
VQSPSAWPSTPSPTPAGCSQHTDTTQPDPTADRWCRGRVEDPKKDAVLVALGDSVTSAHQQSNAGWDCQATSSADERDLKGSDRWFSYAGRYVRQNPNVSEYYNFARTGYGTTEMRTAAAGTQDACHYGWGRNAPPVALAQSAIAKAKKDGKVANMVATGGINNTNWVDILRQMMTCRAIEAVYPMLTALPLVDAERSRFRWVVRLDPDGRDGP